MKKNLISIVILALLLVNIALTAIMMLSVVGTANRTSALVMDIASVLKLELEGVPVVTNDGSVTMEDTVPYDIADAMTIPLKKGEDGVQRYCMVQITLSMNSKHEDYEKYGEGIATSEGMIKDEIITAFSSYTVEELQADSDLAKKEILERLKNLYKSDFIFNVSYRDIKYS